MPLFGSLSSPECIRDRAYVFGAAREPRWSNSGAIWEHTLIAQAAPRQGSQIKHARLSLQSYLD